MTSHPLRERRLAPLTPSRSEDVAAQLTGLRWRGRCDRLMGVHAALSVEALDVSESLLSRLPPPVVLCVSRGPNAVQGASVRGAAGWSGRSVWDRNAATRAVLTAAAGGELHQRCEAAAHSVDGEALRVGLSCDPDPQVRKSVARHPECGAAVLAHLAGDSTSRWVRTTVGEHPLCPPKVLTLLSCDSDGNVREAAAKHRRCPSEVLDVLAGDADAKVLSAVADNPNAGPDALARLASDDTKHAVARHPRCPPGALDRLAAHDADYDLLELVAQHPNAAVGTLQRLVRDPRWPIRYAVAKNSTCPPALLDILINDEKTDVRSTAALHPNARVELLERLAEGDGMVALNAQFNLRDRPRLLSDGSRPSRRGGANTATTVASVEPVEPVFHPNPVQPETAAPASVSSSDSRRVEDDTDSPKRRRLFGSRRRSD